MSMATAQEAREKWWDEWWRADFSWQGLAKRRVAGWYVRPNGQMTRDRAATLKTRPATLQDVWRSESGRLVTGSDMRQWTVVHAPLDWQNQTPAKAGWPADEVDRIERALTEAIARFPAAELDLLPPAPPARSRQTKGSARTAGFPLDGAYDVLADIETMDSAEA